MSKTNAREFTARELSARTNLSIQAVVGAIASGALKARWSDTPPVGRQRGRWMIALRDAQAWERGRGKPSARDKRTGRYLPKPKK